MATTILYGNGLNRVSSAPSWDSILAQLDLSWPMKSISSWNVPNTVQYDQLALQSLKPSPTILSQLCSILQGPWANKVYQTLARRANTNFITTNYDFTLERTINKQIFSFPPYGSSIWERLYNVNTYYEPINNIKIWHIHGDVHRPQSIILGYDHYCKQIAKIERNLPYVYLFDRWGARSRKSNDIGLSDTWATYFFTDDIYIVGLGLGFEELDLWWLIDKWAYYRKYTGKQSNKIVYLDADVCNRRLSKQEQHYKQNFKTVLSDYGIDYRFFKANTWEDAYLLCINAIP